MDRRPLVLGVVAAAMGGTVCVLRYLHAPLGAPGPDIDQAWWAARQILAGHEPYTADRSLHLFATPIFYPLTAFVAALPLAFLPLGASRLLWAAGTAGLFGYALGRHRPEIWPALFGVPFLVAVLSAQWTPLLTAAMLVPWLGWLAAAKPNIGMAMLAGARSRRAAALLVVGGLGLVAVSLAVEPSWPWRWRDALAYSRHFSPLIARPGGFLMLLALLRWRDPDARLLLALSVVPITGLFYDVLPACLVARSRPQAATLALLTQIAWVVIGVFVAAPTNLVEMTRFNGSFALWSVLIPALVLVLRRGLGTWGDAQGSHSPDHRATPVSPGSAARA